MALGICGPLALFVVVNMWGAVSGGHFNPAVTLGVFVREKKWSKNAFFAVVIICSQIAGALVGMLLATVVMRIEEDGEFIMVKDKIPLLLPSKITRDDIEAGTGTAKDVTEYFSTTWMEIVCTFVFVLFILQVTGKRTMAPDLGVWGVAAICLNLLALC